MVLLSGEVETGLQRTARLIDEYKFRMVLLSGEVETIRTALVGYGSVAGSGWFCYPGKLKRKPSPATSPSPRGRFRMVLLSGEVETDR